MTGVAFSGMAGLGRTYAAKGLIELLPGVDVRCDCLSAGVWRDLRASADAPAYSVIVFGGRHADMSTGEHRGAASAWLVADGPPAYDGGLSDSHKFLSLAVRKRFAGAFVEHAHEKSAIASRCSSRRYRRHRNRHMTALWEQPMAQLEAWHMIRRCAAREL